MDFDKEKARKFIQQQMVKPQSCSVCARSDWILLDKIWELGEFRAVPAAIAAWAYAAHRPVSLPVVAMMCNNCGHTIFFNAFVIMAVSKEVKGEGEGAAT